MKVRSDIPRLGKEEGIYMSFTHKQDLDKQLNS